MRNDIILQFGIDIWEILTRQLNKPLSLLDHKDIFKSKHSTELPPNYLLQKITDY